MILHCLGDFLHCLSKQLIVIVYHVRMKCNTHNSCKWGDFDELARADTTLTQCKITPIYTCYCY